MTDPTEPRDDSDRLKPCPFCGGAAECDNRQAYQALHSGEIGSAVAVYCRDCSAQISICREDVHDAELSMVVEMWNRRAVSARVDELAMLVRRLAHALDKPSGNTLLAKQALDYLHRHGLQGSVLRDEP